MLALAESLPNVDLELKLMLANYANGVRLEVIGNKHAGK